MEPRPRAFLLIEQVRTHRLSIRRRTGPGCSHVRARVLPLLAAQEGTQSAAGQGHGAGGLITPAAPSSNAYRPATPRSGESSRPGRSRTSRLARHVRSRPPPLVGYDPSTHPCFRAGDPASSSSPPAYRSRPRLAGAPRASPAAPPAAGTLARRPELLGPGSSDVASDRVVHSVAFVRTSGDPEVAGGSSVAGELIRRWHPLHCDSQRPEFMTQTGTSGG